MANLMDTIAEVIKEEIDQGIDESLPALDQVTAQAVESSTGVYSTGIGRDWKVKHTFSGSISGAFAWRSAQGNSVAIDGSDDGNAFTLFGNNALQTWQGVNEMSSAGFISKELQLKEGYGNFLIPLNLMRADSLDSSIGSVVSEIVKGAAKRASLAMIHSFWKTGANNGIGTFTSGTSETITSGSNLEVTLTGGRIRQFYPGMAVQVFVASDGSTPTGFTANEPVWVDDVNYLAKKLDLTRRGGASTISLANSTGYVILPYDGTTADADNSVGISGLEDWIKDGTETDPTVFGINVSNYSQFRSIKDSGSGALTSDELNMYIGGFIEAYDASLDTIVTTSGVMLDFLENIAGAGTPANSLIQYENQGSALKVKAGFQPFGYVYDGKPYRFMTSRCCPTGTFYVLKLGDQNLRKYVPPKLSGTGSDGRFSNRIEFIAPLYGGRNIFWPVISNDRPTNFLQAPYLHWCEMCPKMVQSIKVTGYSENIYTG